MANKNAKKALEQFKMQAASEVGVNLNRATTATSHLVRLVLSVIRWLTI